MIKVSWSQKFTTAIQKTNRNSIKSKNVLRNSNRTQDNEGLNKSKGISKTIKNAQLQEQLSTFEGSQHLVDIQSVASTIAKRSIEQICTNIADHVVDVSGGNIKVTWMTLYLKVGKNGKMWVLFCSRIKVRDYVSNQISNQTNHFLVQKKRCRRSRSQKPQTRIKEGGTTQELFSVFQESQTEQNQYFCLGLLRLERLEILYQVCQ